VGRLIEVGTVLDRTYKIVRRVGEGGMGEVYEAEHARLSGRYAVKVLNAAVSEHPEALARFRREAQVTSALRHPSIVQIVDFNSTDDGMSYLVMEYLEGANLETIIDRDGALDIDRSVEITRQVASALSAAHRKGIVHRDLKPQNIYLLRGEPEDDGPERAKVLDFGISKIKTASLSLTGTSVVLGTPQYMSPEQAEGKADDVDAATDQFALAAIVYEMLAGAPAFSGDTLAAVVYKVVHGEPDPISRRRPDVPRQVQRIVSKGLSKRKRDRFGSVSELAAELRAAVAATAVARRTESNKPGRVGRPRREEASGDGDTLAAQGTLLGVSGDSVFRPSAAPGRRLQITANLKATTLGRHTGELLRMVAGMTGRRRGVLGSLALVAAIAILGIGIHSARRSKRSTGALVQAATPSRIEASAHPAPPLGATVQPIVSDAPNPPLPTPVQAAEFDIASDPSGIPLMIDGKPYPNLAKQSLTRAHGALTAGPHTFELTKPGFQPWRRTIDLRPGAPFHFIARMRRVDATAAAVAQQAWPPPVPSAGHSASAAAAQPPRPPSSPCSMMVGSVPWAEIWIDGENIHRHTPATGIALSCGPHRLDLRRSDLNRRYATDVILTPGKPLKQVYHFDDWTNGGGR
jgi:serine/threonine protein kinase